MFDTIEKGLTLGKTIKGISKSLNVVNDLIPIYKEFKPTVVNARKIIGSFINKKAENNNLTRLEDNKKVTVLNNTVTISNKPTFFN